MVGGIRRRSDDSTTSTTSTGNDSFIQETLPLNYRRPYLYLEPAGEAGTAASIPSWADSILQNATSACWVDEERPSNTGQLAAPWTEWLESGIEFFGCEGDGTGKRKQLAGRTRRWQPSHIQPLTISSQEPTQSCDGKSVNSSDTGKTKLAVQDYAKLHEDFLESLLKEQGDLTAALLIRHTESRDSHAGSSVSSGVSSVSSGTMESGMAASTTNSTSSVNARLRRKPLKVHRLSPRARNRVKNSDAMNGTSGQKRGPNHDHHHARVAPIEAYNHMYNPAFASNETTISLSEIAVKSYLPDPPHYVHPLCLLQKDKGRGEDPKSAISASGCDSCLEKLREKMRLVVHVSGDRRKASTGMKRRVAKVSRATGTYVETRSMIELQMGFLSMQYGLLLQWDILETGKIVYICLRKMCHDSFYSNIQELLPDETLLEEQRAKTGHHRQEKYSSVTPRIVAKQAAALPLVVRSRRGNHAIYQRSSGATEVVLVDPPYRVPHPDVFAPSVLTVDVHEISGLDKKSQWILSVTFDGHTEVAHLQYNADRKIFETTRDAPCKWEMMVPRQMTSFDEAGLEIRLFEHRPSRRRTTRSGNHTFASNGTNHGAGGSICSGSNKSSKQFNFSVPSRNQQFMRYSLKPSKKSSSRLASTMTMPLGGLVSQPCDSQTTLWKLTMPFTHDERAQLTLTLVHQSDYAHWLYRELRARRKEAVTASYQLAARSSSFWRSSLLGRWGASPRSTNGGMLGYESDDDEEEADELYLLDRLCGICIK